MTLDVVIATHTEQGILRVEKMNLPAVSDIRYIIGWQNHNNTPIPVSLIRKDISIIRIDNNGVSANRNICINNSKADVILIADDDIRYLPGAFTNIISCFSANPRLEIATFKSFSSNPPKYPLQEWDFSKGMPKDYWVKSFEIAFRNNTNSPLSFNESFGPNSGIFESGDDEIFLISALKKHYVSTFFPITIACHPNPTTNSGKKLNKNIITASGAVITKQYPLSFYVRIPLKAYRIAIKRRFPFIKSIFYLFKGSFKSFKIKI